MRWLHVGTVLSLKGSAGIRDSLGARISDSGPRLFGRVIVVGYAQDEVDEVMRELVEAGFAHASGSRDAWHYVPSALTEFGGARLKVLRLR